MGTVGVFTAFLIFGITTWAAGAAAARLELLSIAGLVAGGILLRTGRRQQLVVAALLGAAVGVGSGFWGRVEPVALPAKLTQGQVTLRGVVADREERVDGTRLLIADATTTRPHWRAPGLVVITYYRQAVKFIPGDEVELPVKLRELEHYRTPGGFDYSHYQRLEGIVARGSGKPGRLLRVTDQWRLNRWRHQAAVWIYSVMPPELSGMGAALLVGKRSMIERNQRDLLQASGIYHLISISGLHLALVGTLCFVLFRRLLGVWLPLTRRYNLKRPAALLAWVPMTLYSALAGWSLPTQRSWVMTSIFLFAVVSGRFHQGWRSLGLAAALLLVWQPEQLFQAGFQFSFLAVAVLLLGNRGLGWLKGRIAWAGWLRPLPEGSGGSGAGWGKRLVGAGAELAIMSLIVGVLLAPVAAYHFHQVTIYSLIANLVAIPVASLITVPAGLAGLLLEPLAREWGGLLLVVAGESLRWIQLLMEGLAGLPGFWWRVPGPTLVGLAVAVAGGALGVIYRKWWWLGVALVGLAWPHRVPESARLRVAILDVGQAQAVAIRTPGGGWSVIDAGGYATPYFDIGEAVVSPFLWHYGVSRLERVVVSHAQQDHLSGVERLLRNFTVGELWLGEVVKTEKDNRQLASLLNAARELGVPIRTVAAGVQVVSGEGPDQVGYRVLHPPVGLAVSNSNDRSLVVELEYRNHRFLFPGDLERGGESRLVKSGELAPVTLLVAPHHGSKSSSSPRLVAAVDPRHVVFSVGRGNRYGFPDPGVVERWRESGARIWRTDRQGTLQFVSAGAGELRRVE